MNEDQSIRLTQYAKATGCSCKLAPSALKELLDDGERKNAFANLLVGNDLSDDAAVWQLNEEQSLIATVDFFTPIVDEAFDYGRIAAANALSDVYAMGGKPLMALAILGWPESIPLSLAAEVMQGAKKVCAEAGIPLAGGHSIISSEPVFGLSVNGIITTAHLKRNSTAQAGDLLYLTKPIGSGILATARKRAQLAEEDYPQLLATLTKLNSIGALLGAMNAVTSMTDITGFGLGGHLIEMASGAGLTARIDWKKAPLLESSKKYAAQGISPDSTFRNWNSINADTKIDASVDMMEAFRFLPDPQTNGGLLFSVRPDARQEAEEILRSEGYGDHTEPIGTMTAYNEHSLVVA